MNFSGFNPHKIKKKKFPLAYFGRCDFDPRINYPRTPGRIPDVAVPTPVYADQWEDYATSNDGMIIQARTPRIISMNDLVAKSQESSLRMPAGGIAGRWDMVSPAPQFSGFFLPFIVAPLVAGFLGTMGAYFWGKLREAGTEAERQEIKSDLYDRYKAGDIDEETYRNLLLYQDEDSFSKSMLSMIWSRYGIFVGGGLLLLIILMFFRR